MAKLQQFEASDARHSTARALVSRDKLLAELLATLDDLTPTAATASAMRNGLAITACRKNIQCSTESMPVDRELSPQKRQGAPFPNGKMTDLPRRRE